jgi:dolichol-phosphate mannosyltransferase
MKNTPDISIVVPVYREEKNIQPFLRRMESVLEPITKHYEIIFCCDPSTDATERIICEESNRNPRIQGLIFSRRFLSYLFRFLILFTKSFSSRYE